MTRCCQRNHMFTALVIYGQSEWSANLKGEECVSVCVREKERRAVPSSA